MSIMKLLAPAIVAVVLPNLVGVAVLIGLWGHERYRYNYCHGGNTKLRLLTNI